MMFRWRKNPETLVLLIAAAFVATLLPGLSACSSGDASLQRVIGSITGIEAYPLPDEAETELSRFHAVYEDYAADDTSRPFRHFTDAFRRVRVTYVEEVSSSALIDAAVRGVRESGTVQGNMPDGEVVEVALDAMLESLDPHSSYLNPEEFRESRISTKGEFGGLGIEITAEEGLVKIISPIEDTPADRAGLQPGDLITHVDGEDIGDKGLLNAVNRLRGPPGSRVLLTIRRDERSFDVTIVRAVIHVRSVRWHTEGDIGYIRVTRFTEQVSPGIVKAMSTLRGELGQRLAGVVLDLRNNPGGLLDQSLILADAFLDHGRIVSVRGRLSDSERVHAASSGDVAAGLPIVVLINNGSASAAEIVAGALQDNGRAIVVGSPSFGKGSVQTITPLPIEGALRLTTALYYSPAGHPIQARGIQPDIRIVGQGEEQNQLLREADLPNALGAQDDDAVRSSALVPQERCAGDTDTEDPVLACALHLLRTGSKSAFLDAMGATPPGS